MKKHWAICGSDLDLKSGFFQGLITHDAPEPLTQLSGLKGAIFSNATLSTFIKEEVIHDDYSLSKNQHRSIQTFSSGEQKKALLDHLLSKKPEFLIIDNAFDMLDQGSQKDLFAKLEELSSKIHIIQLFKRRDSLLPFIENVLQLENDKVIFNGSVKEHQELFVSNRNFTLQSSLPPATIEFDRTPKPFIRFKNINVSYGTKQILSDVNWEIEQGDFWQLMGPNGSGKTTLLTMLIGSNPKAYGQDLTIFGQAKGSGESIWDIKKKIGYVTPAMAVLFQGLHTVENMVISGIYDSIGLYQKPSEFERHLAGQWIELIGMTQLKKKLFTDLSEEQQCIVLIARAMIKHPPLLILDEPTNGLDDYNVSMLIALVNKIAAESQTTIIYVSHRHEPGLEPQKIYKLIPSDCGSVGETSKI